METTEIKNFDFLCCELGLLTADKKTQYNLNAQRTIGNKKNH
jgi:hypothetical protein